MNKIISYLDEKIINTYKDKLLEIKNNFEIFKEECNKIPIDHYIFFDDGNKNNNYWNVYLVKSKNIKKDIKNLTPKTFEILSDNLYYNVFFSLLKPNTKINLHKDNLYFLYRSHLGIDVPENYKFICNGTDITTNNEEINIFDLKDEHEVYNFSNKNRIVLIVDILKIEYLGYF